MTQYRPVMLVIFKHEVDGGVSRRSRRASAQPISRASVARTLHFPSHGTDWRLARRADGNSEVTVGSDEFVRDASPIGLSDSARTPGKIGPLPSARAATFSILHGIVSTWQPD